MLRSKETGFKDEETKRRDANLGFLWRDRLRNQRGEWGGVGYTLFLNNQKATMEIYLIIYGISHNSHSSLYPARKLLTHFSPFPNITASHNPKSKISRLIPFTFILLSHKFLITLTLSNFSIMCHHRGCRRSNIEIRR